MICNYSLLLFIGIMTHLITSTVASEAIIGGDHANMHHEFPYQVSLQFNSRHFCGGAIIDEHFILTAAHCVVRNDGQFYGMRITVLAGTNNLQNTQRPAVTRKVIKIFVSPEYVPMVPNTHGDIAILKLSKPLKFSRHIQKLYLPNEETDPSVDVVATIAGFGWDKVEVTNGTETGKLSDAHLRYAETYIMSRDECQTLWHRREIIDKLVCAKVKQRGVSKPRGVCTGDSGSPLVDNYTVIGILSLSAMGCKESTHPAIYTRVSAYLHFILDAMENRNIDGMHISEFHP